MSGTKLKSVGKIPPMVAKLQKFGKVDSVKVKIKIKAGKEPDADDRRKGKK